ncbi:MAG: hypothetical protein HFH23_07475 [Ruminococcus sp.]|nr:hypothetical protein [Ruminococcus sp.]
MAIYILGRKIGRAVDSMEFIRAYKEPVLGETSAPIKYVITEISKQQEWEACRNAGIGANQLVGMHQGLTENWSVELTVKVEEKLEKLKQVLHCTEVSYHDTEIWLIKDGYVIASILLDEKDKDYLWAICYFGYAKLLRMEVYTDGIVYMNSYITATSEQGLYAKLAKRTFYNKDGSVAYDQIFEGEREWFLFPDGRLCTKSQMVEEFIKKLNLSGQDVVLLDGLAPDVLLRAVFMFGKAARLVALAHVGHVFEAMGNDGEMPLKGYYYDWLPYTEMLDTIVVPTEEQKKALLEELEAYHCNIPNVKVAPIDGEFISVGAVKSPDGNLVLSWNFKGKPDGFLVCGESGVRIGETRSVGQSCFLLKKYEKKGGFVVKAYVDTAKGKMTIAESERF